MANVHEMLQIAAIADLEEAEQDYQIPRRQFLNSNDPFECLSDKQFIREYRLTKPMVVELIHLLTPLMTPASSSTALDVPKKVLVALNFFAYGSYQQNIGHNINTAVSQSSVSRCLKEVTEAMNQPHIFARFVRFPENFQELRAIQTRFFNKYGFPGTIGSIDRTHVAIYPPKIEDPLYPEAIYVNRKGYHSINVYYLIIPLLFCQICDADLKILNVCAQHPGGTNDAFIWNNCEVHTLLQNLHRNGHTSYHLIGDSGYPLRPWLLTPLVHVEADTPEERYNRAQMRARSVIERLNGVLKLRFRCLLKHRVLHYSPEKASSIINTCVMLHNFYAVDMGIVGALPVNEEMINRINPDLAAGRRVQQQIIRNYFFD
ncbi:hypothetical protein RN001_005938 [Aquatica leii]|uniref:DDE Tnp4 domain-containing protein n=1 Tax=Aquatica leii TaxID=1421715 RepID=A0AAN7Q129_9COLE|nr:hypothetical protein RN001_005938 [Aquatica leii]